MRRHLIGLGLGVAMLIIMFFGGAWGYLGLLRLPAAAGAPLSAMPAHGGSLLSSGRVIESIGAVAVTGLIAGILIAWPWISPLATGLPGLVALAWTGLYLGSVKEAVDLIPLRGHAFGAGWEALLFNGILGLAGLAMITPMCLPARWRDPYAGDDEVIEAEVSDAREYVADLKATMRSDSAGSPRRNPAGLTSMQPGASASRPGTGSAAWPGSLAGRPGQSLGQPRPSESQGGVLTGRPISPSGQRLTGGQQRMTGGQQRMTGGQHRVTGGQQWPAGAQQRLTGGQQQSTGSQSTGQRPAGLHARLTDDQQTWRAGSQG